MSDDAERLVVLLEARMRDFERNMLKAAGISQRDFNTIRRNSKSASTQMEADWLRTTSRINQALAAGTMKIGAYAKAFGGGFLGGAFAGGLVTALGRITRSVAEVGYAAQRAGLDFKSFQELAFVAKQSRVGVDALTDGMKELLLRADEFIQTGTGSGAEAFRRLGLYSRDLAKKLKDPSALFTEIIGKLKQFDKAAQIRIADELFGGTGGEQFVQLIDRGEEGIRKQIDAAHKLGLVLDNDVIRQAQEIDKKFGQISDTIAGWVQPKVIAFLDDVLALIDRMRPTTAQSDDRLDKQLADIGERRLEIENEILRLRNEQRDAAKNWNPFAMVDNDQAIKDLQEENEELAEQEKRILAIVAARQQLNAVTPGLSFRDAESTSMDAYRAMKEQTDAYIKEAGRRAALTKDQLALETEIGKVRNDALKEGVVLTEKQIEAIARANIEGDKARNITKRESDYERLTKRIQEATAAQTAETEAMRGLNPFVEDYGYAVERARVEQELLNAAQRDGVEITPELAAEIDRMADGFAAAAAASRQLVDEQEKVRREAEESASIIRDAIGGALEDVFLGGMDSSDKFFDHLMKGLAGIGKEFARLGMSKFMDSITGRNAGTSLFGGSGGVSVANANVVGREVGRVMAQPISDRFSTIGNDLAANIRAAANTLGVSARDLATVISYETGGTFSTSIRGGAGGRHIGLIQFGPEEQRKYGAAIGQTLSDQMQAVVDYLKDRGLKPGMDLLDLYSTINAGRPGLYNRSDAANGGAPGTVYDKVTGQMADHQATADRILGKQAVSDGMMDYTRRIQATGGMGDRFDTSRPTSVAAGGMTPMEGMMGTLGAGIGAFANGYSSGDPLMGGISGAFSGFGAAGAIGAAFPALAGIAAPIGIVGGAVIGRPSHISLKRKDEA